MLLKSYAASWFVILLHGLLLNCTMKNPVSFLDRTLVRKMSLSWLIPSAFMVEFTAKMLLVVWKCVLCLVKIGKFWLRTGAGSWQFVYHFSLWFQVRPWSFQLLMAGTQWTCPRCKAPLLLWHKMASSSLYLSLHVSCNWSFFWTLELLDSENNVISCRNSSWYLSVEPVPIELTCLAIS